MKWILITNCFKEVFIFCSLQKMYKTQLFRAKTHFVDFRCNSKSNAFRQSSKTTLVHRPYVSYTYYIYEQVVVHQCVVVSASSQHDVHLILRLWKRHYILISLLALCDNLPHKNSINRSHNQFASEANDISKKCAFAAKNCVLHIFCQLQSGKSFFKAIFLQFTK